MAETAVATVVEAPAPAPVPPTESAALISMIERAARDPNVDIEKMERLFAMHERIAVRRAEEAYNAAMSAAQSEMVPVVKNKKNDFTNSSYADMYAIADAALPIAHRHGFGLSFSECPATQPGCMGVSCEVTHGAGFSKRYTYNVPIDKTGAQGKVNKTDTQAYGSTFTYSRRYATCGVFNIAITDKDGNKAAAPSKPITEEQVIELRDIILAVGADEKRFCALGGVERLADIPASQFEAAKAKLAAKGARK